MPSRHKRPWSKQHKRGRKLFHVHTSVLNIDKRLQDHSTTFETNSSTIICDNSANVHICSSKSMLIVSMCRNDQHYVSTIGGSNNSVSGMGTFRWRWKDDLGKIYTLDIENLLYFPQSPVNIFIITGLADQLKYNDGMGIDTNSKLVGTKVCTTKRFFHCRASTLLPEDDGLKSQAKLIADMFHVGETILYSNSVHTPYIKVEEILLDDNAVLQFSMRTNSEELIESSKSSLPAPDDPDTGWIPTTILEKTDAASNLSEDDLNKLTNPVALSPLQD